ncbi:MAG TPA: ferritin-like domain-containing protein [Thermoanaerobaculia bacterium]|nr:ferritin-like domain-containing protein [Thermoanaerobaculia bacterium]
MPKSVGESNDLASLVTSRRKLMAGMGFSALGWLGASALRAQSPLPEEPGEIDSGEEALTANDINILNFALNIEYLGAEFYLRAVTGSGLSADDVTGQGNLGNVQGGSAVPFQNPRFRDYAEEIARNERAHVQFLRATLGENAVARPEIDLQQGFTLAARAAGLIGPTQQFNPFANEVNFWLGAFMFEDVDVTAYKGAAPLLSERPIVEAAAGILAVEGYHAGLIRTVLYELREHETTRAISNLRDQADGFGDRDQPIRLQAHANIVPTDGNGLAFSRTPQQVLSIVYLGGEPNNFGFFPERVNGAIR